MTKRVLIIATCIAVLLLVFGGMTVHLLWRAKLAKTHHIYMDARAVVLSQRLSAQEGPYIVLAGDSHAEFLAWDRICDLPVVNLGMSGAGVRGYLELASKLSANRKAAATLLFMGTNDLARVRRPETGRSLARFQSRFERLIQTIQPLSQHVFYVPLMPDQARSPAASYLNLSVAKDYRLAATDICTSHHCTVTPVGDLPLSFKDDGVHVDLADRRMHRPLFNRIEAIVCPALKLRERSL